MGNIEHPPFGDTHTPPFGQFPFPFSEIPQPPAVGESHGSLLAREMQNGRRYGDASTGPGVVGGIEHPFGQMENPGAGEFPFPARRAGNMDTGPHCGPGHTGGAVGDSHNPPVLGGTHNPGAVAEIPHP